MFQHGIVLVIQAPGISLLIIAWILARIHYLAQWSLHSSMHTSAQPIHIACYGGSVNLSKHIYPWASFAEEYQCNIDQFWILSMNISNLIWPHDCFMIWLSHAYDNQHVIVFYIYHHLLCQMNISFTLSYVSNLFILYMGSKLIFSSDLPRKIAHNICTCLELMTKCHDKTHMCNINQFICNIEIQSKQVVHKWQNYS